MAMKKGRAVSATEKPLYEHLTHLFHQGAIHAFWAYDKNDWAIQSRSDLPVMGCTLDDVKGVLRALNPEGCTWDTTINSRTGKAALLDLSRRLLTALTTGDCDERLVTEATALISAA